MGSCLVCAESCHVRSAKEEHINIHRVRSGTVLGLVGRSDEFIIGTSERLVEARVVCAEQRGDAKDTTKSARGVLWQPNPVEAAEGEPVVVAMARTVSVPMIPIERRLAVPVMEPREYRSRRSYIRREVEFAKIGYRATLCGAVER